MERRLVLATTMIEYAKRMMERNSSHFYANACHVCKQFGILLVRCQNCNMIAYCDREHQRQHWAEHQELCIIILQMITYPPEYIEETSYIFLGPDEWRQYKETYLQLVENRMNRSLCVYEQEMFLFPRNCIVCHTKDNLTDCMYCASVSFCFDHVEYNYHPCAIWRRCIELDAMPDQSPDLTYIHRMPDKILYSNRPNGYNSFFSNYIRPYIPLDLTRLNGNTDEVMSAMHSQYTTHSLTVLYAMEIMNYNVRGHALHIHIIGSDYTEIENIETWEILLHSMPQLKYMHITVIGVDLIGMNDTVLDLCASCTSEGKEIFILCYMNYTECYHNNPLFAHPHLVVGFNVEIHRDQQTHQDMANYYSHKIAGWIDIETVLRCTSGPLIFTFPTVKEAERNMKEMNQITYNQIICHIAAKFNPFASSRPYRSFQNVDIPIFSNSYINVYSNPRIYPRTTCVVI